MSLNTLPPGSLGFDCNEPVNSHAAKLMRDAGFKFAVRYVPRVNQHNTDITCGEMVDLISAGLGVMLVQHFPGENWVPITSLGSAWGGSAANFAEKASYPKGATLWCDIEGVLLGTPAEKIIGYANKWFDQVKMAGYEPGLYLGFGNGLTAEQAYWKTKFTRFWAAYNLNRDEYPAVRSIQMKQKPFPPSTSRVKGITFQYDIDEILVDAKGSSPILFLPDRDI